jgi:5'-3' exonuclease
VQVHLIDGTYELFRAWFGAPPAQTSDGREVGATRTVLRSMAAMVRTKTITHGAVAFDHVIESFRNDLFAGYKTGEGLDPRLVAQFEMAERAADAVGLVAWPMIEFEADDAIATAAARLESDPAVDRVVITAVDKDMCQCVRGTKVVCWDRFKDVYIDEPGVVAKHGVAPESIPDLLALVGDTADGIPGISGWGKVSAGKVLAKWKHIASIPENAASWGVAIRGADGLAASLREHRETLELYRTLATLRTDCPIATDVDTLTWRGADRAKLDAFCREIELDPSIVKTA